MIKRAPHHAAYDGDGGAHYWMELADALAASGVDANAAAAHPVFTQTSLDKGKEASAGWLEHWPRILGALGVVVAFGHSLLAMSGEDPRRRSIVRLNRRS